MPETNTARSKKYLEKQGYSVWVVEQNVNVQKPDGSRMCFKRDAWNFGDLLAFSSELQAILLVQTTTTSNQSSRIQKILSIPEAEGWLKSRGRISVHGWKKRKKTGRWELTVTVVEIDKDFGGMRARELTLEDSPLFLQNAS